MWITWKWTASPSRPARPRRPCPRIDADGVSHGVMGAVPGSESRAISHVFCFFCVFYGLKNAPHGESSVRVLTWICRPWPMNGRHVRIAVVSGRSILSGAIAGAQLVKGMLLLGEGATVSSHRLLASLFSLVRLCRRGGWSIPVLSGAESVWSQDENRW